MSSRTQQERTESTRRALVEAGRKLFARKGFDATGTQEVVAEAGLTRGALYHHFPDKRALFEAVYEAVEADVVATVNEAANRHREPLDRLKEGADAFLDACTEADAQRITLIDAPAVLGWERWRELDDRYGLGLVKTALRHAMEAGAIRRQPVDALAHVILSALTEAALMVARSDDRYSTRLEVGAVIDDLLAGLATP